MHASSLPAMVAIRCTDRSGFPLVSSLTSLPFIRNSACGMVPDLFLNSSSPRSPIFDEIVLADGRMKPNEQSANSIDRLH